MMPTLFHWEPNAGSLEVLAALHEKGVAFESRYVDFLAQEMWRQPFASKMEIAFNLEIEGPVLVTDSGEALSDSAFINLTLDEAYPGTKLRPADAEGQWHCSVWARWIGEELAPVANTLGCAQYTTPALRGKTVNLDAMPGQERRDAWQAVLRGVSAEELEDCKRKVAVVLKRAEDALAKHAFLVGESVSVADFNLLGQAISLPKTAPEILKRRRAPRNGWSACVPGHR